MLDLNLQAFASWFPILDDSIVCNFWVPLNIILKFHVRVGTFSQNESLKNNVLMLEHNTSLLYA